jgi:hypothetical protein
MLRLLGAGIALSIGLQVAPAGVYTLTDNNSAVQLDVGVPTGLTVWSVDGINQAAQHSLWYRVGASGPESSISTLGTPTVTTTGNSLTAEYTTAQFTLTLLYTLLGGGPGSGVSSLSEQITVQNSSGSALDFHFFRYTDFDVGGDPAGDSVELMLGPGMFYIARQSQPGVGVEETVNTPAAVAGQAGVGTANLDALTDANPTTLNNTVTAGPGDVNYILEFVRTLAPEGVGSSVYFASQMGFELQIIPEPSAFAFFALGIAGFVLLHRRH